MKVKLLNYRMEFLNWRIDEEKGREEKGREEKGRIKMTDEWKKGVKTSSDETREAGGWGGLFVGSGWKCQEGRGRIKVVTD